MINSTLYSPPLTEVIELNLEQCILSNSSKTIEEKESGSDTSKFTEGGLPW